LVFSWEKCNDLYVWYKKYYAKVTNYIKNGKGEDSGEENQTSELELLIFHSNFQILMLQRSGYSDSLFFLIFGYLKVHLTFRSFRRWSHIDKQEPKNKICAHAYVQWINNYHGMKILHQKKNINIFILMLLQEKEYFNFFFQLSHSTHNKIFLFLFGKLIKFWLNFNIMICISYEMLKLQSKKENCSGKRNEYLFMIWKIFFLLCPLVINELCIQLSQFAFAQFDKTTEL
jgi:hypothetical protein